MASKSGAAGGNDGSGADKPRSQAQTTASSRPQPIQSASLPPPSPLPTVSSPTSGARPSHAAEASDSSISLSTTPKQSHLLSATLDPRPLSPALPQHSTARGIRTAPSTSFSVHNTHRDSISWGTDDGSQPGGTIGRGYPSVSLGEPMKVMRSVVLLCSRNLPLCLFTSSVRQDRRGSEETR